jgi:hypothetical protein
VEEREAFAEDLEAHDVSSVEEMNTQNAVTAKNDRAAVKDLVYSAELKYLNN